MIKKALFVKIEAKAGKEKELESFLTAGLNFVNDEPLTINWYAVKFSDSTFGIFDTFESDEGRDAHHHGKFAEALMANVEALLTTPPSIEKLDVIVSK